jgi:hypothetical protein
MVSQQFNQLLPTIPGVEQRTAENVIAEADMSIESSRPAPPAGGDPP